MTGQTEVATFAAGCFWGVEKSFKKKFGEKLKRAQVGYAGGATENPSYRQVCSGATGHAEALQLEYNPAEVDFPTLVDFFYRSHDPTTKDRQGNDRGSQYRSAILYHNDEQKQQAEEITEKVRPHFGKAGIATSKSRSHCEHSTISVVANPILMQRLNPSRSFGLQKITTKRT
ncbi:Peptide-methionine (S)-S-oxide reductase [Rhizophlyctis rosea]|nr:Peptide-methionine (S)-S-oxide reductase [Rhizophlyctis rosea]